MEHGEVYIKHYGQFTTIPKFANMMELLTKIGYKIEMLTQVRQMEDCCLTGITCYYKAPEKKEEVFNEGK